MNGWLAVPRDWLASMGDIMRFASRVVGVVYSGRVLTFFGESLRQAGILIVGSTLIIWGLIFILGLSCGIEGAYLTRAQGAPAYAGVFSAWCDLREIAPYAFGYMLAAKVGTGIVAELGSMRISDEIDALEVMGVPPVTFLAATRLLAAWMTLPFIYLGGIGVMYIASYIAVVHRPRARDRDDGDPCLLGSQPESPDRGLTWTRRRRPWRSTLGRAAGTGSPRASCSSCSRSARSRCASASRSAECGSPPR